MKAEASPEYHEKFETVLEQELAFVQQRWNAKAERRDADFGSFNPKQLRGLALSGGGIRSASFCMGVLQQLHVAGVIDRLHYLSTVSGGGYSGCSLTWFMSKGFGTQKDDFPFWGGAPAGVRNASTADLSRKAGPVDGRTVLDYIRQRSSYLNPGAGFSVLSALAIVLRSILVSLLGYVLLLALFFSAARWARIFEPANLPFDPPILGALFELIQTLDWAGLTGLALLASLGVLIVLYSLATGVPWVGKAAYRLRRGYQRWAGILLGAALALFVLTLFVHAVEWLGSGDMSSCVLSLYGGGSTAAGAAIGGLVRSLRRAPPNLMARLMIFILPPLALFLVLAGLGVLGLALAETIEGSRAGLLALTACGLVYCLVTNINLTGLHRFYRDRLMETFLPDPAAIPDDRQAAETSADQTDLADVCAEEHDGPYHLINAHVVLVGGKKARLRSRRGDSFLLSRLYSGSEATGYISTREWLPGPAKLAIGRRLGAMKLPTAMAISGAALHPRTGADGQGLTKGGVVSALLNILNLRLGYWVPSPKKVANLIQPSYRSPPNLIFPSLFQGLFGMRHNEDANWVELSDGGHFENTGIYELVRRGVRTIIFADGSTDPEISLTSFANALEKIYIDFGVTVRFDDQATEFTKLMKGTAALKDILSERLQFSESGFAIGSIHYPSENGIRPQAGTLFYIKSTMIRQLPTALYSYKASNPLFPAESLADQFFSEQQFEAYRALGYALTESMIQHAHTAPGLPQALYG